MDQSKTCARCAEHLPLSAFYRNRSKPGGYVEACKECVRGQIELRSERSIKRRGPNRQVDEHGKTCRVCDGHKPLADFYRQSNGRPAAWCKDCTKARMRAIREPHLVMAPKLPRDESGKICPRCRTYKVLAQFERPKAKVEGTYCRPCEQARNREAKRRNAEAIKRRRAELYARPVDQSEVRRCPRCEQNKPRADFPASGKAGYCRPCRAAYGRDRNRKQRDQQREDRYGYTPEQFATLLAKQGGGCSICGTTQVTNGRWRSSEASDLHVDHDHATGHVRGLLCNRCNMTLGLMDDDPNRLIRAAEYLKNPPALM